jgi:hypothetical protein
VPLIFINYKLCVHKNIKKGFPPCDLWLNILLLSVETKFPLGSGRLGHCEAFSVLLITHASIIWTDGQMNDFIGASVRLLQASLGPDRLRWANKSMLAHGITGCIGGAKMGKFRAG